VRQVWFALLGAAFGVVGIVFAAAFGLDALDEPATAVAITLWFVASRLYVLGGLDASVGDFEWYQLVGLGNVCLGLQLLVRLPFVVTDGTAGTEALVATIASGLGGLTLLFIGFDWFRGGRHFDLSAFDESLSTNSE
jgi:hypothetical protein